MRKWWVNVLAAGGAVGLHALMLAPLVMGSATRVKPRAPDRLGLGSSAIVSSAEMVSQLVLIEMSVDRSGEKAALSQLASRGIAVPHSTLIASPSPNPLFEREERIEEDSVVEPSAAEAGYRVALFGRYMGQVAARIERAWIRPRTPLEDGHFECQTRIEQDRTGRVRSVELQACTADPRWQQSLVLAIERASPLTAPPDPAVFAEVLVLNFSSEIYEVGSRLDQFEPSPALVDAAAAGPLSRTTSGRAENATEVRQHAGHIQLQITGTITSWELQGAAMDAARSLAEEREEVRGRPTTGAATESAIDAK